MKIRFVKGWCGRQVGDEVDFDEGLAKTLIEAGFAEAQWDAKAVVAPPANKSMARRKVKNKGAA